MKLIMTFKHFKFKVNCKGYTLLSIHPNDRATCHEDFYHCRVSHLTIFFLKRTPENASLCKCFSDLILLS